MSFGLDTEENLSPLKSNPNEVSSELWPDSEQPSPVCDKGLKHEFFELFSSYPEEALLPRMRAWLG